VTTSTDTNRGLYLDLMKMALTGVIYEDPPNPATPTRPRDVPPAQPGAFDDERRANGEDWPLRAHTMVGLKRLDNLQACIEKVVADRIPGDFIETGVWRGGVCIFMRALLKAYDVTDRNIWVADSFEGMPVAGEDSGGLDHQMRLHRFNDVLGVSLKEVQENFRKYGLLDDLVHFLPGWFNETLPAAPIRTLSILRLDGDLYDSTMDALRTLYPKLAPGGFVIVDDFGLNTCRAAVEDYRKGQGITDEIEHIDRFGAFWRRDGEKSGR
jgi:hypothetical protein